MAEKSDKPEKAKKDQKQEAPAAESASAAAPAAPKKGGKKEKAAKPAEGAEAHGKKQPKAKKAEEKPKDEIKYLVRIANTDLDGTAKVLYALTGIDGIGIRVSKILARKAEVDPNATMGYLSPEQVDRLRNALDNIDTIMPVWMLNRRNDTYTGENRHLTGTDLILSNKEDINLMKKIRSYKGIRHERGQKVRGQRTRSTGRTGATVGVVRKKEVAAAGGAAAAPAAPEKK
ncbi:MAG TPA: 30S ribosomal protein S13 [Methanocella sp.]|uniref:30S ribosomal protein S13 n=1 Tax=Methanocella sp. TaxID=2052833 RepID=UPI002CEF2BFF|nr:30S ribosomal protein S13 [Methanocella sp.]HTY91110.1 30S ribosomal protein S13 [Methanocella sp.]